MHSLREIAPDLPAIMRALMLPGALARRYQALNPDVAPILGRVHLARFGISEERSLTGNAVDDIRLRLRLRGGRAAARRAEPGLAHLSALLSHGDVALDADMFRAMEVPTRVDLLWTYLRHVPASLPGGVTAALLEDAHKSTSMATLRRALDLARHSGLPKQAIVAALERCHATASPDERAFRIRWPERGDAALSQRSQSFWDAAAEVRPLIEAAMRNERAGDDPPLAVSPDLLTTTALKNVPGKVVRLRLLMPQYWVAPIATDPNLSRVLDFHRAAIARVRAAGLWISPVFATPLYDITNEAAHGLPVISYHTLSHRDIRAVHYKEGVLPGTVFSDTRGYSGWARPAGTVAGDRDGEAVLDPEAQARAAAARSIFARRITKYAQSAAAGEGAALPAPFVLAVLQVPDDTVATHAYMPAAAWLETARRACLASGRTLLVKRHPKDRSHATRELVAAICQKDGAQETSASIHTLIEQAELVLCVNSGAGFEGVLGGRPVVTLGASDYGAATRVAKTPAVLDEWLQIFLADGTGAKARRGEAERARVAADRYLGTRHSLHGEGGWDMDVFDALVIQQCDLN